MTNEAKLREALESFRIFYQTLAHHNPDSFIKLKNIIPNKIINQMSEVLAITNVEVEKVSWNEEMAKDIINTVSSLAGSADTANSLEYAEIEDGIKEAEQKLVSILNSKDTEKAEIQEELDRLKAFEENYHKIVVLWNQTAKENLELRKLAQEQTDNMEEYAKKISIAKGALERIAKDSDSSGPYAPNYIRGSWEATLAQQALKEMEGK